MSDIGYYGQNMTSPSAYTWAEGYFRCMILAILAVMDILAVSVFLLGLCVVPFLIVRVGVLTLCIAVLVVGCKLNKRGFKKGLN